MPLVPVDKVGKIQFYEHHLPPWVDNAVAIGTTSAAVTDLQTKTQAARAAFDAQAAAQQAAKVATAAYNSAVKAMAIAGADIIRQIRAKGAIDGDTIYNLAEIPAPSVPAPVGAPGTPYRFLVELMQDGSMDITWKCDNPRGCTNVVYQVWRRAGGLGEFHYVGGSGSRGFLDTSVPAGATLLTYKIQAVRTTGVGGWGEFNVNFGAPVPGNGATVTVSVAEKTPRMAA